MAILTIAFALLIAALLPSVYSLRCNTQRAKAIGLPIITTPFTALSPVMMLLGPVIRPILAHFPEPFSSWAFFSNPFWVLRDKHLTHARLGPAFSIVTPGQVSVYVADPATCEDVLSRTKHFIKPPVVYSAIELFGPNVDTVNGDVWSRHRRLTTPPFNERNSGLVWRESLSQAAGMLHDWVGRSRARDDAPESQTGVERTHNDTMKLALHVLTGAGFGQFFDYRDGLLGKVPAGHELSYRDALALILSDFVTAIMATKLPHALGACFAGIRKMRRALDEFARYMAEMVEAERRQSSQQQKGTAKDNLMSVLVRAADTSKAGGSARESLTDDEIFGNLFIWNLAGHETTASALAFAVTLLSVNRDVQDWIGEEIHTVFGDAPPEQWRYEEAFPRLKRCLALMYETLRLYGPVPALPKTTETVSQPISIQGKQYRIPPECFVFVNITAIQTSPHNWGADSLEWKPRRFIRAAMTEGEQEEEEFVPPRPGTHVAWASGPRVCPGKKFAQVEFVSVIACLLQRHRVRPARRARDAASTLETDDELRQRVMDVVEDHDVGTSPANRMLHPERVRLIWERI